MVITIDEFAICIRVLNDHQDEHDEQFGERTHFGFLWGTFNAVMRIEDLDEDYRWRLSMDIDVKILDW